MSKSIIAEDGNLWMTLWSKNYNNETAIAKDVMAKSKLTYKGDTYIPWALLVGALYRLDSSAEIEKCMNKDGGYVFTDTCTIRVVQAGVETVQTVLSHFVKLRVHFMGKVFEEAYPIQDNDYTASKVYDQNKVNKAQQRGLARTISLATGIGWRLYEQSEAQFEDDKKPPVITSVVDVVKAEPTTETGALTPQSPVAQIVAILKSNKDNDKVLNLLASYNTVLATKYKDASGEPLKLDLGVDDDATLTAKLLVVENAEKLLKGFLKVIS
jgi:hypothetical protein